MFFLSDRRKILVLLIVWLFVSTPQKLLAESFDSALWIATDRQASQRVNSFRLVKSLFAIKDYASGCSNLQAIRSFPQEISSLYSYYSAVCYWKLNQHSKLFRLLYQTNSNKVKSNFYRFFLQNFAQDWSKPARGESAIKKMIEIYPQLKKEERFLKANYDFLVSEEMQYNFIYWLWLYGHDNEKDVFSPLIKNLADNFFATKRHELWLQRFQYLAKSNKCSIVAAELPKVLATYQSKESIYKSQMLRVYLDCLLKIRRAKKIQNFLQQNPRYFQLTPRQANKYLLESYLLRKQEKQAEKLVASWQKKQDRWLYATLSLRLARYFYYFPKNYSKSFYWYDRIDPAALPEYEIEQFYWEMLFSSMQTNNRKSIQSIYQWYSQHSFRSAVYASHLCYWLETELNVGKKRQQGAPICYEKYNNQYYGLLAAKKSYWQDLQAEIAAQSKTDIDFTWPSAGKLELIEWVKVLAFYQQNDLAEDFLEEDFLRSHDLSYLKAIADSFDSLGFYYITQNLYVQSLSSSYINEDYYHPAFLKSIYPLAYHPLTNQLSKSLGVPESLILAIAKEESHFNPQAKSVAGALGLMQLMPKTGIEMGKKKGYAISRDMLLQPKINMLLGASYLEQLKKMFDGNLVYMIASYNAGPYNVKKWERSADQEMMQDFVEKIPFGETRRYVKRVYRSILFYELLYPQLNP